MSQQPHPPGLIPLRPLTFGELLDAAVSLLREHARVYLAVAVVLAAAEQALLYPLRVAADLAGPAAVDWDERLGQFWLLLGLGLGTEAAILVLLGGLTARAAGPALLGQKVTGRQLLAPTGGRFLALGLVAPLVGVATAVAALAGLVPWIFVYGLVGLVAPAIVTDRLGPGRAVLRSLVLTCRVGMRAVWVRLGGYVGWLAIRTALTLGLTTLIELLLGPAVDGWITIVVVAAVAAVNAVAYTTLACLDAVVHLETRMRTEGLDLTLARARQRGTTPALVVAR